MSAQEQYTALGLQALPRKVGVAVGVFCVGVLFLGRWEVASWGWAALCVIMSAQRDTANLCYQTRFQHTTATHTSPALTPSPPLYTHNYTRSHHHHHHHPRSHHQVVLPDASVQQLALPGCPAAPRPVSSSGSAHLRLGP